LNNREMVGLMNWAQPGGIVARVRSKPTEPARESDRE
jgi:hypothetical protein